MNPSLALLDEYGLNQVTYRLLVMVAAALSPLSWGRIKSDAAHEKITGNPAQSLRKLIDRGLLTGPGRNEDINAHPFATTPQGHKLITRLHLGLHRPEWLTVNRLAALQTLAARNNGAIVYSPKIYGRKFSKTTLKTLHRHGYVCRDFEQWRITDLGRQALAEYQNLPSPGKGL